MKKDNRLLNKIKYVTGISYINSLFGKSDYRLYPVTRKDYYNRSLAERHEKDAERHEKGKGNKHALSPSNIAYDYFSAAKYWMRASKPKKAYKDYKKAEEFYEKSGNERESREAQRNADRLKKILGGRWHGLEGKIVATILTIGFFGLSIFFINPNLSGKVISNLNQTTSGIIGAVFFIAGLLEAFVLFKKF